MDFHQMVREAVKHAQEHPVLITDSRLEADLRRQQELREKLNQIRKP